MFIGVDGGGTKTAFILVNAQARILARTERGTTYHPEIGVGGVCEVLRDGIAELLAAAAVPAASIQHGFFGLPAYGEDPVVDPSLALVPEVALAPGQYSCGNDMVCGWAGAFGCTDGISVTAGTGSIAYGEYAGRSGRSGGWGEIFGDEGSAYWIGREGLAAFSRMSDGRSRPGILQQIVRERFSLARDLDLAGLVNQPGSNDRGAMAQLSQLVAAAAMAGDVAARDIFVRAGAELAAIVDATRTLMGVPDQEPIAVSYAGGVFNTGALVLDPFEASLAAGGRPYRLQVPLLPPVVGAALYAARCVGVQFDPEQKAALAASSG
jgi:N-acetylglucosamine kinase-like BadF-type ATPase